MALHPPRVDGRLRQLTEATASDPGPVVRRVAEALRVSDTSYASLDTAVRDDVLGFVTFCAGVWFRSVLDGTAPTESEMQVVSHTARRRVHQGVSLPCMLLAVRLGSRELWKTLLADARDDRDASEKLVLVFSSYLLDYFDGLAQRISAAYLDEQFQSSRWQDNLRHQMLNAVFSATEDEAAFSSAATALGLDPLCPRTCLAMEITLSDVLPAHREGELDRLLLRVSRIGNMPPASLVRAVWRERLVIWIPAGRDESMLVSDRSMHRLATALAAAVPSVRRIGIGLMNHGARGWAMSMHEAFKSLDQGARLTPGQNVLPYTAIALSESLLHSDTALRYLDALVERLSHEPGLLPALRAFLDHGQHRTRASEALGIHPNTLNIRLGRIEALLGGSLHEPGWLARLQVAMTLRRATERTDANHDPLH